MIISRRKKRAGQLACMGERQNAYNILLRNSEGKTPFGRPTCRWKGSIEMDIKEIESQDVDWISVGDGSVAGSRGQDKELSKESHLLGYGAV
jgi:hypothetical protein